jgi:hypothetical protein
MVLGTTATGTPAMSEPEILREASLILAHHWGLHPEQLADPSDYALLRDALRDRILHLLLHNPNKLMSALYIVDVPERRVAQALDQPTTEDRAYDLACAILERETQKIRARHQYAAERAKKLGPPQA